jgi:hypothetical protein
VDKEALKNFLSSLRDVYRPAYGKHVVTSPRLTLFVGTSNRNDVLSDETGNRRYWILECPKHVKDMDSDWVQQIWAEARETLMDENVWFDRETEAKLEVMREKFFEIDPLEPQILEFMKIPISDDWYSKTIPERTSFKGIVGGTRRREHISAHEVWAECLGRKLEDFSKPESLRISKILRKVTKKTPERRRLNEYGRVYSFTFVVNGTDVDV